MRLLSFGGYGLALAALALVVFGPIECPPALRALKKNINALIRYWTLCLYTFYIKNDIDTNYVLL